VRVREGDVPVVGPQRAGLAALAIRRRHRGPNHGRESRSDATLYILYGESLMKSAGRCQNDLNAWGIAGRSGRKRETAGGPGYQRGRTFVTFTVLHL
jgi:hypothetical protein